MNPSLRRLCILAGLVIIFGMGITMALDYSEKNPRALPTPIKDTAQPAVKPDDKPATPALPEADPSPLHQAGKAARDAVDVVSESSKEIAKETNTLVNEAATQVSETAKQVGEATNKAAAEASRLIGEFANGLNAPTNNKTPTNAPPPKEAAAPAPNSTPK